VVRGATGAIVIVAAGATATAGQGAIADPATTGARADRGATVIAARTAIASLVRDVKVAKIAGLRPSSPRHS
jgi:hypothetical protein